MKKKEEITRKTIASEYQNLKADREPWIQAAKEAAKYTIPSIAPEDDTSTKSQTKRKTYTPNQSVGADGVNNLSAKITTTLLPPNQTFFRFKMDKAAIMQEAAEEGIEPEQYEAEITAGLSSLESMLLDDMEATSDRVCVGEAMKHLYITGNVLLVFDSEGQLKYYPLNRYVVKRDYCGNVQKVITEEKIAFNELPDALQDEIIKKRVEGIANGLDDEDKCKLEEKEFVLYTRFHKCKKQWKVQQEVDGIIPDGSEGTYPKDVSPVIPLRYVRVDGEDYGRGLIEDYFGDISYLDALSLAIKEAALAGSKLLMLVKPSGQTSIRKLASAKNGDFVTGDINEVAALQANKYYDLQSAQQMAATLERRLNRIFCMKAAIQREAERVTAEEIRMMAADLEEALGNHYSLMAKEFQTAYVKFRYYFFRKTKKNLLPDLVTDKNIKLTITTGLEALGRTSDLNKWITFFDVLGKMAQSAQIVGAKTDKLIQIVAASMNLDVKGAFYTEEEKQQMQQQAQMSELINKAAPNLVNKAGDAILQQQEQGGEIANEE